AYTQLGTPWLWQLCHGLDVARIGALSVFLLLLVYGGNAAKTDARRPVKGIAVLLSALLLLALFLPSNPAGMPTMGSSAQRFGYMALLGSAILGLVLIEQLLRNAPEDSRWALKPLCLGLGGAFVYNLFMYADAALFSQLNLTVWSAHAAAHALVIPFLALAAVRNRDWTIDIHMSRQVV